MATNAADSMEQSTDSPTATLERKRPHNVVSRDDSSNAGSAHSTPRKRAKHAEKLGHQDVRDFVPVGASFSTSVVPVDEAQDIGDDDSQAEISLKAEILSDYEALEVSESDVAERENALVEGRRLFIRDLPPDTTKEDLKHFFKGYSIENIWLPDPVGDNSQLITNATKDNSSLDGDSPLRNPLEGAATTSTKNGRRLYVGNFPYAATVEDLREFFRGFSLESVTIPVNPRTSRPVGYAFVTVSTSDEADRATSQLSGNEILERKVSVQCARAEEMKAAGPGTTAAEEGAYTKKRKRKEGYHGDTRVKVGEESEGNNLLREISETILPQDVQTAAPMNWNAVNTTKIRTTLGGSVGKIKDLIDEPSLANGDQKEVRGEGHSNRELTTSVALERVEGLRIRLSAMDPHDDPVSAYKSAQQELHDAEVDYNYCLYFPVDEAFLPPPRATARQFMPKRRSVNRERRLCMWSTVEQCMKEGTLQDLKKGKIRVSSAERLSQLSPALRNALESSDGLEQINGQRDLQLLTVTDVKQTQILDTEESLQKQYGFLKALRNMRPGTRGYEKMKKRIHETELNLKYCQYFPITEDYLPLAFAKQGLSELNSSEVAGIRASERRAAQIWKLVEQCTQDGNLQDLKDGRLAAWLKDAPPSDQSFLASALQARHPQTFVGITGHNFEPQHGGGPKEDSQDDAGAASAVMKLTPKEVGNSHERQDTLESEGGMIQGTSESEGGVILNLNYGSQDMPSKIDKDRQRVMNSEIRDEEMPSNVGDQDVKQALQAMNQVDDDIYESDGGTASNSGTESNDFHTDSEGQSEDGDAMMQYSKSEQIATEEPELNEGSTALPQSYKARILADLSSHDLNTQLRYFHTTKAREEVDRKTPVRCVVCAKEGHMAGLCEFLTCSNCGAFNQHTTQACPNNVKCGKCREHGHDVGHCPYKLKKMAGHEIICDLCQRNGHIEEDCELVWRTSGRPWESHLGHADVRLSCYECGHSGHLGNECPSRKPNKSMGTSTWHGRMGPVSIKSVREIKIKGKATKQNPINLDDSDDDRVNFYRPKISVPEPVRKGQIRIVTGKRDSPVYEPIRNDRQAYADHRHASFTPVSQSYRNDEARQPYQQYQDSEKSNWRAVDGPDYAPGHNDLRYNKYRPSERRSRSPPYRDDGGYAGGGSWPLPRSAQRAEHQARRPPADANVYRPMPSSAENAWTRRRLSPSFNITCANCYRTPIEVPELWQILLSDYCDVYLTHDSMSVRKAHNSGRNHERNVLDYYQQIGHEKAQSVIDSITSSYAAEGQAGANPMLAPQGGPPPGGQGFPPPPFGFPAGMPPPPFMPGPGGPGGPPPGFIPPPGGRGMPPFPPFPPSGSPAGNGPPMPGMPGGMPFPPPGGMPPGFQGFPPPMGGPGQGMSPLQGGFPPPQGMPPFQGGR